MPSPRLLAVLVLVISTTNAYAQGNLEPIGNNLNEQVVRVPIANQQGSAIELEVTVFRPPGQGPFPVLIINHGKSAGNPKQQGRARYFLVAKEFVRRGYLVVLPMRQGFANSGGSYFSAGCNMLYNAQKQAADVAGVYHWLKQQPYANMHQVMVFGQSYGGLATLALASKPDTPIRLSVNFAGGLKILSSANQCDWQGSLIEAMSKLGQTARSPSLWFYGDNDSYFGPALSQQMAYAYQQGGAKLSFVRYGTFKADAHRMFGDPDGWNLWLPKTLDAMRLAGLPTDVQYVAGTRAKPRASGYAVIDNPEMLPYLQDSGRRAYENFLKRQPPRAFALSDSGAWGWASGSDDSMTMALTHCQKHSATDCRLYAVDDEVVWPSGR